MKKIIVTDLDGTFLEPDGKVPKNAKKFLKYLRTNGYTVVFATARPLGNVKKKILGYAKPDWIICNDGAMAIELNNNQSSRKIENNLPFEVAKDNIKYFKEKGFEPLFFLGSSNNFDVFLPESANEFIENDIRLSDETRKIIRYKDVSQIPTNNSIRSITLYGDISKQTAENAKRFNQEKANVLYYKETRFEGRMWLDVISKKADKHKTSFKVAKSISVSKIDIALGNGTNDLALITNAQWSACPITSDDMVKNEVDFVCEASEGNMFLEQVMQKMEDKRCQAL